MILLITFDFHRYVILGDGCQMEGISNEACSLAGHWGLGKLIAFYDDNHISIDGDTEIAFTESVDKRFEGLGWHVIWVKNGNTGYDDIRAAIKEAKAVKDKPTLIKVSFLEAILKQTDFQKSRKTISYFLCFDAVIFSERFFFTGDNYYWLWFSKQG